MKLATVYSLCNGAFISLSKYIINAMWDEDIPPTTISRLHDHFTWVRVTWWYKSE
jgi:hypothetical protein